MALLTSGLSRSLAPGLTTRHLAARSRFSAQLGVRELWSLCLPRPFRKTPRQCRFDTTPSAARSCTTSRRRAQEELCPPEAVNWRLSTDRPGERGHWGGTIQEEGNSDTDTQATRRPCGRKQRLEGCSSEPVESRDDPDSGFGRLTRRRAAGSSAVSPPADSGVVDSTSRPHLPPGSDRQGSPQGRFPSCPPGTPAITLLGLLLPCVSKPGVHTLAHRTGQDVGPTRAMPLTTAQGLCPHTRVFRVFEALGTHAHVAPGSVVTVLVLTRARLLCALALVHVCNRDTRLGRATSSANTSPSREARTQDSLPHQKHQDQKVTSERRVRGQNLGQVSGVEPWTGRGAEKGQCRWVGSPVRAHAVGSLVDSLPFSKRIPAGPRPWRA